MSVSLASGAVIEVAGMLSAMVVAAACSRTGGRRGRVAFGRACNLDPGRWPGPESEGHEAGADSARSPQTMGSTSPMSPTAALSVGAVHGGGFYRAVANRPRHLDGDQLGDVPLLNRPVALTCR
jgi:hypothetical protein